MAPVVFQNATAYNAASLTGVQQYAGNSNSLLLWFTPAASYDGTVALQISPDGGVTFFPLPLYDVTSAIGTAVYSIATPVATKLYVAPVPMGTTLRVLMSGGSVGTLTATGLLTSFLAQ